LNLIPEPPPPDEDSAPWTYYRTPGLTLLQQSPNYGPVRGFYYPANGSSVYYAVVGNTVYTVNIASSAMTSLGTISSSSGPVAMQDNTIVLMICDGSANGWYVTLTTNTMTQVSDPAFYGATHIAYLDTFLLFNKPGSNQWYSSPSNYAGNSTPFDSLYIATKSSFTDNIVGMASVNQLVWLIGAETSELWYDAGAADFPFARVPEVLIHHGCLAPYSIATTDGGIFWLSSDEQGKNMVLHGAGYQCQRVSTFPIEYAISQYGTTSDAIGMTYQQAGHVFYVLTFPTADATWVYDVTTQQWHERCWLDAAGEHRIRMNCVVAPIGGGIVAGDWQNGAIYSVSQNAFTDNGAAIKRQRAFPHALGDGNRVFHRKFTADLSPVNYPPGSISLDWSDNRGLSYGTPVTQPMSNLSGMGLAWWRLGLSRDRVYRLTWTESVDVALQGAWIEADSASS
jgi:hypothetical protein